MRKSILLCGIICLAGCTPAIVRELQDEYIGKEIYSCTAARKYIVKDITYDKKPILLLEDENLAKYTYKFQDHTEFLSDFCTKEEYDEKKRKTIEKQAQDEQQKRELETQQEKKQLEQLKKLNFCHIDKKRGCRMIVSGIAIVNYVDRNGIVIGIAGADIILRTEDNKKMHTYIPSAHMFIETKEDFYTGQAIAPFAHFLEFTGPYKSGQYTLEKYKIVDNLLLED
jgi:hypothetical protein